MRSRVANHMPTTTVTVSGTYGRGRGSRRHVARRGVREVTTPRPKGYDPETMDEFYRIKRLPPYVFAIVNDLKTKARARGQDVIDLGMGNPDLGTPKHIVAKLIEAAQKPQNHRYSASR